MEKKVYCKVILKETKEVIGILEKPYAKSFSDHPEIFEVQELYSSNLMMASYENETSPKQ